METTSFVVGVCTMGEAEMDNGSEFSLRVEDDGRGLVILVSGEVDVVTSPALYECLKGLDEQRIVTVDMSNVTFLDSSGLSALVVALKARKAAGGDLLLSGVKPAQRRIFDVTGLDAAFNLDGP